VTAPEVDGPTVPDEESLAFEALVVARVTADIEALLRDTVGVFLSAYGAVARAGAVPPETARTLARAIAIRLRRLAWSPMDPRLRLAAREARSLGFDRAIRRLSVDDRPEDVIRPDGPIRVPAADAALRDRLREAARLAGALDLTRRTNVLAVAGKVRSGLAVVKGHARWTANEGINAGTAEVAKATGRRLLWVPERDACLHCLARAGWVVEPGDEFPAGISYDPLARSIPGVPWPPLHPNCRCEVRTYDGPAGPPDENRSLIDPAARLGAEARRSVVYQWTDHASGVAARRAAETLLRAGAGLPSSVEDRARRALRRGGVRRPR
jgi:hypothetical protein